MCLNSSKLIPCSSSTAPSYISFRSRKPSRGCNLQYCHLSKRRMRRARQLRERKEKKMEMMNLKLYMKNKSIIQENEKLRKKAYFLNQENQALLFQLQTNSLNHLLSSHQQSHTITTLCL